MMGFASSAHPSTALSDEYVKRIFWYRCLTSGLVWGWLEQLPYHSALVCFLHRYKWLSNRY